MPNDFQGSIAQKNMTFSTQVVVNTTPGANYGKLLIFVGNSDAATYLVETATTGYQVEVTSANYTDFAKGLLLDWLSDYFAANSIGSCWLVVFNDLTTDTPPVANITGFDTSYGLVKTFAYFKTVIHSVNQDTFNVELGKLAKTDKENTQVWIGSSDTNLLTNGEDTITAQFAAENYEAFFAYHPDATRNPALLQLGITLGVLNSTGTVVGNSAHMVQTNLISASGTSGANLTSTQEANLVAQKVHYYTTIGNDTGEVALECGNTGKGGQTSIGNYAVANWIVAYAGHYCKIKWTEILTRMNTYKNDKTYQAILTVLGSVLNLFYVLGRLGNLKVTSAKFSDLPSSPGNSIVIPNAWTADFISEAEKVSVGGTLTINQ